MKGAAKVRQCCSMRFARLFSISFTIKRLVSRNLSTQFDRQLRSEREKPVDGVPVMHLAVDMLDKAPKVEIKTNLSQHMLVKL